MCCITLQQNDVWWEIECNDEDRERWIGKRIGMYTVEWVKDAEYVVKRDLCNIVSLNRCC